MSRHSFARSTRNVTESRSWYLAPRASLAGGYGAERIRINPGSIPVTPKLNHVNWQTLPAHDETAAVRDDSPPSSGAVRSLSRGRHTAPLRSQRLAGAALADSRRPGRGCTLPEQESP